MTYISLNPTEESTPRADRARLDGKALEGLRRLEDLAKNTPPETELPLRVPLSEIEQLPVFYSRECLNERLIVDLAKVLDSGGDLPAVTVLRAGGKTFLVDGHHRLEAFRVYAGRQSAGERFEVPVAYFSGTPSEAVFASIIANSRHGVRLTASERTDAAWKLVLIGEKNRKEITHATGVARSWITKMRQVKRLLDEEAAEYRNWHQALREANGRTQEELSEEDFEERKRMRAERIADQITKTIGKHCNDPELMAMAMEVVMGRKVVPFIQHLNELQYEALEEARLLDEDAEF